MKRYASLLIFVCILLISFAAFAQVEVEPAPAGGFWTNAIHQVFLAMSTIAVGFLVAYLKGLAAKNGIQLTAEQEDLMKKWAVDAISYAEEMAANYFSKTKTKMSATDKLETAKSFLKVKALSIKTALSDDEASKHVHAALPLSPFGAVDPVSGRPE